MARIPGMETAKIICDLRQDGVERYVALMRHGERIIDTAENDLLMDLTEEGKRTAYEFGRSLPSDAPIGKNASRNYTISTLFRHWSHLYKDVILWMLTAGRLGTESGVISRNA